MRYFFLRFFLEQASHNYIICARVNQFYACLIFLRLVLVTCFPALGTGCMFSRASLAPVAACIPAKRPNFLSTNDEDGKCACSLKHACFNKMLSVLRMFHFPAAFGTGCMFSRVWHRLHVLPRLALVTCFPALGTGYMFSRAWHWLHVFPRLAPVACMSRA